MLAKCWRIDLTELTVAERLKNKKEGLANEMHLDESWQTKFGAGNPPPPLPPFSDQIMVFQHVCVREGGGT